MQIVQLILAILKAIFLGDKLKTEIENHKIDEMKKENGEAVKTSLETGDQRSVEIAMGSTKAGEEGHIPGSVVVDKLPGLK